MGVKNNQHKNSEANIWSPQLISKRWEKVIHNRKSKQWDKDVKDHINQAFIYAGTMFLRYMRRDLRLKILETNFLAFLSLSCSCLNFLFPIFLNPLSSSLPPPLYNRLPLLLSPQLAYPQLDLGILVLSPPTLSSFNHEVRLWRGGGFSLFKAVIQHLMWLTLGREFH